MSDLEIKIQLCEDGRAPTLGTEDSAGWDCYARTTLYLPPLARGKVPLGFAMELPRGWEAQGRPRSGLFVKHGVCAVFGTIDADYRNEVCAMLINLGQESYHVKPGDRVMQLVLAPVYRPQWTPAVTLSTTQRGTGGFGSTGR